MAIKQKRVSFSTYVDADKPNKIQKIQARKNMDAANNNQSIITMADLINEAIDDLCVKYKIK